MEAQRDIFTDDQKLAEDLYALSAVIDRLVEERAGVTEFVGHVAERLCRNVTLTAFGRSIHSVPGRRPRLGGTAEHGRLRGETIHVDIDPPLPAAATRLVEQRLTHATRVLLHHEPLPGGPERGFAEKLRWLLSAIATGEEQAAIRREIGWEDDSPVTVVAVAGGGAEPDRAERLAESLSAAPVVMAYVGEILAVVVAGRPSLRLDEIGRAHV